MKRKIFKVISVVLTVVLLMSVFVTPVAAGRERGSDGGRRNVPPQKVQYLDAEVRVIGGQPVLMVEVPERFGYGEEYVSLPLALPQAIPVVADGQAIELEVKNNSVLVPTEDGIIAVSITDFCVVMIDGKIMLVAEEEGVVIRTEAIVGNPIPKVIKVVAKVVGVAAHLLHLEWTAGTCLSPACLAPTPDGSRGDLFCGHRWCPATITSLLRWLGP